MRLDEGRESSNIEDRRDEGFSGGRFPISGGSLGIGGIVITLAGLYFGIDPSILLQGYSVIKSSTPSAEVNTSQPSKQRTPEEQKLSRFVSIVLADTEDTWKTLFNEKGKQYSEPKLVLFSRATRTACGTGQSAMGPFYCPLDQKVYIDLDFYNQLQRRFKAPGDFAQAYVIAHEVGHHVQNLLGVSSKVHQTQERASKIEANALSVRLELQADCLAGVWANHADKSRHVLEQGDVEEALTAATAIGDDSLQKQSQGYVVPESFTHGSSQQRVYWFKQGMEKGTIESCNTFKQREP
ncbi:MAG: neutral zinc metallopeptidase [Pseudomonadota bacterium]